jgi:uncharacterized protein (TIGR02145 family)
MKKYLSLIILTILAINLFAQDITVSFKTSDEGAVIDSVLAINLATNATVILPDNETLTLVNSTNGVPSIRNVKGSIFPNPCNSSATLQFSTNADDDATIQIVNSSGQLVMDKKKVLSAGAHSFSVGFPSPGIYIVLARTGNEVLSFKEASNMVGMQEASLSYLGSSQRSLETATLKSATTGITLNYSTGNNIMYTLYSGKNIRVMIDQPTASKTYDVAFYECADKNGKNYKTVTIGTQTWMAENLAYLPSITSPGTSYSFTEPCYYVYDYDGTNVTGAKATSNYTTYGVLYNWSAAMAGSASSSANPSGVQGVCPVGWHLPSDAECIQLTDYLGGESVAGGKLKETGTTHWSSPNTDATNETGFTALPGGYHDGGGVYRQVGDGGTWWSATKYDTNRAWGWYVSNYSSYLSRSGHLGNNLAFSVRCVRD